MELARLGRPFAYVPLDAHFEQQVHVPFRLGRLGVGHRLRFADLAEPDRLSEVTDALLAQEAMPRLPAFGGARAAAERIAALI
jgi:hypothetical protein